MILTRITTTLFLLLWYSSTLWAGGIESVSITDQEVINQAHDLIYSNEKDAALDLIDELLHRSSKEENDIYQAEVRVLYAKYLLEVKGDLKPKLLSNVSEVSIPEWKNPISEYDYHNRLYRKIFDQLYIAENHARKANKERLLGEVYYLMAKTNYYIFHQQESVRYCYLAIKHFDKQEMFEMKGAALFLLSSLYFSIGDAELGEEVLTESIKAYYGCQTPYCMGRGHLLKAKYFSFHKNSDSAIHYYQKAEKELLVARHPQKEPNLQTVYLNLGAHFDKLNQVNKCLKNYKKAMAFNNYYSKKMLPTLSYNLAITYYEHTNQIDSVYHYLNLCERYTQELGEDQNTFSIYNKLSRCYEEMGDYQKALDYHKLFKLYHDSITKNIQLDSLLTFKLEFEYKKKEEILEITKAAELSQHEVEAKLKHNALRTIITVLLMSLGVIVLLLILSAIRFKLKRNIEEGKQKDNYLKLVLQAQYKERKRIARFLHDNCGASLAAVKLSMITMQSSEVKDNNRIDKLLNIISGVSNDIRSLSHELLPQQSDSFGLALSIEGLLEKLLLPAGIHYVLNTNLDNENIGDEYEFGIYQIVVELTNNVLKHSKAKKVVVELVKIGNRVELVYKDNGIGKPKDIKKGVGQNLISAQLIALNGNIQYTSEKGWLRCSVVFIQ